MTSHHHKNSSVDEAIQFAIVECYLGWVIVAATERGICLIAFGDNPDSLHEELSSRFPKGQFHKSAPAFSKIAEKVVAYLQAPDHSLDVPLDIQGTAFQRRVWEALQSIPAGKTASYSDIAQQIAEPTATRAIARACAENKLAVAIPCHRVIRKDGEMGGYRWGLARKHKLLKREATTLLDSNSALRASSSRKSASGISSTSSVRVSAGSRR